jgi:cytochrome P450
MQTYPTTRLADLVRLLALLTRTLARHRDLGEAVAAWLGSVTERYNSSNIFIGLIFRRVLFVSSPELSAHLMALPPSDDSFVAGSVKRTAMSFLAPHALTILHDDEWRTFRAYNEQVLQRGLSSSHMAFVLVEVQKAFSQSVHCTDELRQRMGRLMLNVVFGEGQVSARLAADVQELFAEVSFRTALLGSRKKELRDRFRGELRRLWQSRAGTMQRSLLALAHEAAEKLEPTYRDDDRLIDQIPHWMFTFTGSGADLLARSLAMISARQETLDRIAEEIEAVGMPSEVENIHRLRYLEACILETGRLFPPVVQTTHRAARSSSFDGFAIPAGTEIVQFFPFTNRARSTDPLAGHFCPDRWLDASDPIHKRAPNLFLSGARACPGRNLILFIEKAAIARLVCDGNVRARRGVLSVDPLPFSFPGREIQF